MFSDDAHYFMPIRRTRMQRELDKEFTQPAEMAFFDDNKMLPGASQNSRAAGRGRRSRRRARVT